MQVRFQHLFCACTKQAKKQKESCSKKRLFSGESGGGEWDDLLDNDDLGLMVTTMAVSISIIVSTVSVAVVSISTMSVSVSAVGDVVIEVVSVIMVIMVVVTTMSMIVEVDGMAVIVAVVLVVVAVQDVECTTVGVTLESMSRVCWEGKSVTKSN